MSTENMVGNEVWDALTILLASDYCESLDDLAFEEALIAQASYLAHESQ
jgi:hypothetical protein